MTIEAVLHWDRWATVHQVEKPFPTLCLPLPYVQAVESEVPVDIGSDAVWNFRLKGQDENDVLHYYADEPPWAPQIRAAMNYARRDAPP